MGMANKVWKNRKKEKKKKEKRKTKEKKKFFMRVKSGKKPRREKKGQAS